MTEKEAWLEIARRFRETIPPYGICCEIYELEINNFICTEITNKMNDRIADYKMENGIESEYLWPVRYNDSIFKPEYNIKRAELCESFARDTTPPV